jgi:hypothetical protein
MPPLEATTKGHRSKTFDRALALIAAIVVAAIIMVARY